MFHANASTTPTATGPIEDTSPVPPRRPGSRRSLIPPRTGLLLRTEGRLPGCGKHADAGLDRPCPRGVRRRRAAAPPGRLYRKARDRWPGAYHL